MSVIVSFITARGKLALRKAFEVGEVARGKCRVSSDLKENRSVDANLQRLARSKRAREEGDVETPVVFARRKRRSIETDAINGEPPLSWPAVPASEAAPSTTRAVSPGRSHPRPRTPTAVNKNPFVVSYRVREGLAHRSTGQHECAYSPSSAVLMGGTCYSPPGISNMGNTCYLNSLVQCLLGEKAFVDEIVRLADVHGRDGGMGAVTRAMVGVIEASKRSSVRTMRLDELKAALASSRAGGIFAGFQQQDAHEAFVKMIECIRDENGKAYNCPFSHTVHVEITCEQCGHRVNIEEPGHLNIMVDVRAEKRECVADALGKSRERLSKDCDACKEKLVEHVRTSLLTTLPQVMVVQLRRFAFKAGRMTKVDDAFLPQRRLVVSSDASKTFQLRGIISHHGNDAGSGHYDACVRRAEFWHRFNDGHVATLSERDVFKPSRTHYLLFYDLT